jgi:hypothetical protein
VKQKTYKLPPRSLACCRPRTCLSPLLRACLLCFACRPCDRRPRPEDRFCWLRVSEEAATALCVSHHTERALADRAGGLLAESQTATSALCPSLYDPHYDWSTRIQCGRLGVALSQGSMTDVALLLCKATPKTGRPSRGFRTPYTEESFDMIHPAWKSAVRTVPPKMMSIVL